MLAVVAKNHELQISSRWLIFALSSCGRVSAISSCVDTPTSARQISFPTTIRFLLIFLWFVNSRATVDKTARTLSKLLTNPATSHPRREIQFSSPPYMEEEYGRLEWLKTSTQKRFFCALFIWPPMFSGGCSSIKKDENTLGLGRNNTPLLHPSPQVLLQRLVGNSCDFWSSFESNTFQSTRKIWNSMF